MKSRDILGLLANRHSKDVFVPECKNGPSYCSGLRLLDAWAMARSWAHPKFSAYEIKVSRQDFLRDDKWREALPLCNEFWWAAPPGIIEPSEIAAECGLLVTSTNGTKLYCKKRAPYRDIEPPTELLLYILMCRAKIEAAYIGEPSTDYWREWLAKRDEEKELGHKVSKRIRELVETRIEDTQRENQKLHNAISEYQNIVPILQNLNLVRVVKYPRGDVAIPTGTQYGGLERAIRKANEAIPDGLIDGLRNALFQIEGLRKKGRELPIESQVVEPCMS